MVRVSVEMSHHFQRECWWRFEVLEGLVAALAPLPGFSSQPCLLVSFQRSVLWSEWRGGRTWWTSFCKSHMRSYGYLSGCGSGVQARPIGWSFFHIRGGCRPKDEYLGGSRGEPGDVTLYNTSWYIWESGRGGSSLTPGPCCNRTDNLGRCNDQTSYLSLGSEPQLLPPLDKDVEWEQWFGVCECQDSCSSEWHYVFEKDEPPLLHSSVAPVDQRFLLLEQTPLAVAENNNFQPSRRAGVDTHDHEELGNSPDSSHCPEPQRFVDIDQGEKEQAAMECKTFSHKGHWE